MKYFLDTEFIEGFHKPLFGKKRHFIDLISIGLVCEDGSTFYAISNEYNYNDADQWVKDNVILPLYKETVHGDARNHLDVHNFHKHFGRSNKDIMCDLLLYVWRNSYDAWMDGTGEFIERGIKNGWLQEDGSLENQFYAYYADYDWVLFCSLFGRMIDLPNGFPMYCIDLKQVLDYKALKMDVPLCKEINKMAHPTVTHNVFRHLYERGTVKDRLSILKEHKQYPKQENEHSALDDAKWNFELYKFLQTI